MQEGSGFGDINLESTESFSILHWHLFCSELCSGKAMVAYTKPQKRKKEERERPRGERDQIKFIYLRFERWQIVRCREARR